MPTYIRLTDYKSSEEKERGFFKPENRYEAKQEDFEKIPGSPIAYWINKIIWKLFKEDKILNKYAIVKRGPSLPSNEKYVRKWHEIDKKEIIGNIKHKQWFLCNKSGGYEKWYAKTEDALLFMVNNKKINISNKDLLLKECIIWSDARFGNKKFSARYLPNNYTLESVVNLILTKRDCINVLISYLNSKVSEYFLNITIEGQHFSPIYVKNLPFYEVKNKEIKQKIDQITQECIDISKEEWDSRETSWDFRTNELIRIMNDEFLMLNEKPTLETVYQRYCDYWRNKFFILHKNEEELNRLFIEIYELQDELTPDVPLEDITILKNETKIVDNELVFQADEIMKQFISYGVGVMLGRYSLDHEGLHIADMSVSLEEANLKFNIQNSTFEIDDDNIIPVLEDDYFKDDIASRFVQFVKATFGEEHLSENVRFIERSLGKSLRRYFVKDFYEDHIKRYKKRPIYWMVSSPKKGFMSLIYMHRYKSDTFARVRNSYLSEYIAKLEAQKENLNLTLNSKTASNKDKKDASKAIKKIEVKLKELIDFDRDVMMNFARDSFEIDLDDGVKVNYCRFKDILYPIKGLCK